MSDPKSFEGLDDVYCRRLDREIPATEHCKCNYCFGRLREVRSGEHDRFCDYDPEKDPLNFGFPQDFGRRDNC